MRFLRGATVSAALPTVLFFYWIALFNKEKTLRTGDEYAAPKQKHVELSSPSKATAVADLKAKLRRVHNITSRIPPFGNGARGLIFFLHIPKTGGTTIRRNFRKIKGVDYFLALHKTEYNRTLHAVDNVLKKNSLNTVFLEVHANSCPHLLQLKSTLLSWRETAKKNKVPIFFFTLLRNPIDFAISYFNFFHVQQILGVGASLERCDATVENFLRLTRANPQVEFLARGGIALLSKPEKVVSNREFQLVHDAIIDTMDWVGTTEKMADDTLLILSNLTNLNRSSFRTYNAGTREYRALERKDLNESVSDVVLERSLLDTTLYEDLKRYYA